MRLTRPSPSKISLAARTLTSAMCAGGSGWGGTAAPWVSCTSRAVCIAGRCGNVNVCSHNRCLSEHIHLLLFIQQKLPAPLHLID